MSGHYSPGPFSTISLISSTVESGQNIEFLEELKELEVKILSAGETAVIFSLEPIFAALFSIFMGVESFGALQWTGGIIVVLSVIYYSKSSIE